MGVQLLYLFLSHFWCLCLSGYSFNPSRDLCWHPVAYGYSLTIILIFSEGGSNIYLPFLVLLMWVFFLLVSPAKGLWVMLKFQRSNDFVFFLVIFFKFSISCIFTRLCISCLLLALSLVCLFSGFFRWTLRVLVGALLFRSRNLKRYICLKLFSSRVMGWIVSPKKICWSPNLHHLRMWPRLEIGSLRWVHMGLYLGRWAPGWIRLVSAWERRMPVGADGPRGKVGHRHWWRAALWPEGCVHVPGKAQGCWRKAEVQWQEGGSPGPPRARRAQLAPGCGTSGFHTVRRRISAVLVHAVCGALSILKCVFILFSVPNILFSLVISLTHGFF